MTLCPPCVRHFGMKTIKSAVQKGRNIGGASRPHRLAKLDGRTREARRLRQINRELTDHVGGSDRVSAAQKYLIARTAIDILRLELLDAEMAAGTVSNHDARVAHALRNTVRLALRALGMKAAAAKPPSAAENLAAATAGRTTADILAGRAA